MSKPFQTSAAPLPDGMRVKAPTADLTGQRFGWLLAICVVGKAKSKSLVWECRCDCGATIRRASAGLRKSKGVSSCGCYLVERRKTHLANLAWNKGTNYRIKGPDEPYANRAAWAKAVRAERSDKCERCGWAEASCDVHHRQKKSEGGAHTRSNAIVLCPNCHRVEHERGGVN